MTEHATRQPSSADRLMQCTGSAELEALYPDDGSEYALEGTAAHWALAEVLNGRAVAEGQVTDAGFVLTAEMVQAAESTLRWVQQVCTELNEQPATYWVEQKLPPGRRLHAAMWGTPDLVMWFAGSRALYVLDLKFGRGWVEAFENWQLTAYLALALDALGIDGLAEQAARATLVIDQPRAFHPEGARRFWHLRQASDARGRFNLLSGAIEESLDPERAKLRTGPACEHCKARHACPALQDEWQRASDRTRRAVPFDLTPQAVGIELAELRRAAAAIKARETGLVAQAEAMIARGDRVPGWQIDRPPGRLAWTVPTDEVLVLGEMLGLALRKPPEAITPTQAKDLGLDMSVLGAYAARPAGAAKLVPIDDATARKIFT